MKFIINELHQCQKIGIYDLILISGKKLDIKSDLDPSIRNSLFFPVGLFEFTGPLCLAMCWILAPGTSLLLFHLVVENAFILAENWKIPILIKIWELKGSKSMEIAHREYRLPLFFLFRCLFHTPPIINVFFVFHY